MAAKPRFIVNTNDGITSFEQPWILPLIADQIELVAYSADQQYSRRDCVLARYQAELEPNPWYQSLVESGHRLIIDHLWDGDVDAPSTVDSDKLTLRNGNWLWYHSSIEWYHHGYNHYQPKQSYQYRFFMPINKRRHHRDVIVRRLADLLDSAVYSYVAEGRELEHNNSVVAPWVSEFDPVWYDSTCISVVCESYMRSRNWLANPANYKTEISEKSFKPIAYYHPAIIVGSADTVKYLQREGFATWDNLWSESYDSTVPDAERLEQVIELIRTVVEDIDPTTYTRDPETVKRLAHNHDHFFDQQLVKRRFQEEIVRTVLEFAES